MLRERAENVVLRSEMMMGREYVLVLREDVARVVVTVVTVMIMAVMMGFKRVRRFREKFFFCWKRKMEKKKSLAVVKRWSETVQGDPRVLSLESFSGLWYCLVQVQEAKRIYVPMPDFPWERKLNT